MHEAFKMLNRRSPLSALPFSRAAVATTTQPLHAGQLAAVQRAIRAVLCRFRVRGELADDFAQDVWVHVLTHPIFERFSGQSTLHTYLVSVCMNLFRNQCQARKGRWRASVTARRLGEIGIEVERLTVECGLSRHEAVETLCCKYAGWRTRSELERVVDSVLIRVLQDMGRNRLSGAAAEAAAISPADPSSDLEATVDRVAAALRSALAALDQADRAILAQVHGHDRRIRDVAEEIGVPPRAMYRRIERLHAVLRSHLMAQGIEAGDVRDVLFARRLDGPLLHPGHARGRARQETAS